VQRAAWHLCEEIGAATTDRARLIGLLHLIGPDWLSMLDQLEGALARYDGTIEDVADCVRYDQLIKRIHEAPPPL
jgi:hypothetical protein